MIYDSDKVSKIVDLLKHSEEGKRHVRFFAAIPDRLVPFMPGFWWNQEMLFALDLDPVDVDLAELEVFLDVPIWRATGQAKLFSVTGRQILENPDLYEDHWNRVMLANTDFPITMYLRNGIPILLDGYHRSLQAFNLGKHSLRVVYPTGDELSGVLESDGFLGELNSISQFDREFISLARRAALMILENDPDGDYREW